MKTNTLDFFHKISVCISLLLKFDIWNCVLFDSVLYLMSAFTQSHNAPYLLNVTIVDVFLYIDKFYTNFSSPSNQIVKNGIEIVLKEFFCENK